MSHKEEIAVIDRELRKLQAQCVRAGYNRNQIEKFAHCFFRASAKARREWWTKIGIAVAVFILLVFVLFQFQLAYRLVASMARTGLIQLLALWDWTQVYRSSCLLANPLYRTQDVLVMDDCQICDGIQGLQRIRNVDPAEVVDKWFRRDIPVIIEDGLRDLDDVRVLTPLDLAQLFETDEVLRSASSCSFSSNVGARRGELQTLLHQVVTGNISHYYAHWENCQRMAAKVLRSVFKRPYFLPPAVETSTTNWIFISRNFTGRLFKQVKIDYPLILLLQVSGQVDIEMEAWSPCDRVCPLLRDTLYAGEALVITELLWKASYRPVAHYDNLAVGLGASF